MVERLTFGQWLKVQRERRRPLMTQQHLAEAIEVDRSYVVKVETGRIGTPTLETRQRIHAVLGTSEQDLVDARVVMTGRGRRNNQPNRSAPAQVAADAHNPFDRGTWHWVVVQRVRGMNDEQAEDVASFAEYILTRKKTDLPVIVRGSGAGDPIVR